MVDLADATAKWLLTTNLKGRRGGDEEPDAFWRQPARSTGCWQAVGIDREEKARPDRVEAQGLA